MEWLNLKTAALRDPRLLLAEPVVRATWVWVLAYCVEQENGGIIKGAASWSDREWSITCGVTKTEVFACPRLIAIKDADIHVWGYPTDQQQVVRAKRDGAKRAAIARWSKEKVSDASKHADAHANASADAVRNRTA